MSRRVLTGVIVLLVTILLDITAGTYQYVTDRPEYDHPFVFGKNIFCELGFISFDSPVLQIDLSRLNGQKILDVQATDNWALLLTERKQVFAFGTATRGELCAPKVTLATPQLLSYGELGNDVGPIKQIATSRLNSYFLKEDGSLIRCSSFVSPHVMPDSEFGDSKVQRVAAGPSNYALFLSTAGRLFKADTFDVNVSEVDLALLNGAPIRNIYTGSAFGHVLTETDELFGIGTNLDGQLGSGSLETTSEGLQQVLMNKYLYNQHGNKTASIAQVSLGNAHAIVLTSDGRVFTYGKFSQKQLGRTINVSRLQNAPAQVSISRTSTSSGEKGEAIIAVHAGYESSIAITARRIFAFGSNEHATIDAFGSPVMEEAAEVHSLEKFMRQGVPTLNIGNYISFALVNDGRELYTFGDLSRLIGIDLNNITTPIPKASFDELDGQIKQIRAGANHVIAVLTDGTAFAAGDNSLGQLGSGFKGYFNPLVKVAITGEFKKSKFVDAAPAVHHTLFLTDHGDVYVAGANYFDTLGFTMNANIGTSFPMKLAIPEPIKLVAASERHSVAISNKGNIYMWGAWGRNGYATARYTAPTLFNVTLNLGADEQVVKVEAGLLVTFLLTSKKNLLAFGPGLYFYYGIENSDDTDKVYQLFDNVADFDTFHTHTIVLRENGDVFVGGINSNGELCSASNDHIAFRKLDFFAKKPVSLIATGGSHSLFLTQQQELYMCGVSPKLSNDSLNYETYYSPELVDQNQMNSATLHEILFMSAGRSSSYLMARDVYGYRLKVATPYIATAAVATFIILCFCCCGGGAIGITAYFKIREARLHKKSSAMRDEITMELLGMDYLTTSSTVEDDFISISTPFEIDFKELSELKEIGSGASGIVFKAKYKGRDVAIKMFKTRLVGGGEDLKEFTNELDLLSKCRDKNIVYFYGACLRPPRVGIVFEYCGNGTLQTVISKGKTSWTKKLDYTAEIARGLSYLHSLGIVHRDMKPENILIDNDLHAKLTDFGIAKTLQQESENTMKVGTSIYIAPEVTLGKNYNEKCDIFSFGIMMYEILTENFNPYQSRLKQKAAGSSSSNSAIEIQVALDPEFRPIIPNGPHADLHPSKEQQHSNATYYRKNTSFLPHFASISEDNDSLIDDIEAPHSTAAAAVATTNVEVQNLNGWNSSELAYIEVMKRCWHHEPEQRPNCAEIIKEIERCYLLYYDTK